MGDPDADAIAAAALAVPGVAGLHGGALNEVAAYLPGRTVPGVRLALDRVEVHVVARYGSVLPALAEAVRAAVAPQADALPVEVHIDDLDIDPDTLDLTEPAGSGGRTEPAGSGGKTEPAGA